MTKIAVLGSHPATKMQAPFEDRSWRIYACSTHNVPCSTQVKAKTPPLPRFDEFYEVHTPAGDPTRPDDYLAKVRELSETIPVWMRDRADYPKALEYPNDEVLRAFGAFFHETSSIYFIVAKAILDIKATGEADNTIGVWGVMQESLDEYTYQLPGIQYILQRAMDIGIHVVTPTESGLLAPRIHKF